MRIHWSYGPTAPRISKPKDVWRHCVLGLCWEAVWHQNRFKRMFPAYQTNLGNLPRKGFSMAITACFKPSLWSLAVSFLEQMQKALLTPETWLSWEAADICRPCDLGWLVAANLKPRFVKGLPCRFCGSKDDLASKALIKTLANSGRWQHAQHVLFHMSDVPDATSCSGGRLQKIFENG